MQCQHCHCDIPDGQVYEHLSQVLCEDCYMDALSPVRTCDPWAVHSAKSFESQFGGQATLTPQQKQIMKILKETGGIERDQLVQRMGAGFSDADLDRAFAPLRHMEKVRAEKRDGRIYLKLW